MATSGEEDEAALLDRMDAESGLTVSRTSPFSPSWLIEKCALSWQQRLVGFVMFFVAGTIMSVMSSFSVPLILAGDPSRFAVPYTLGNLCSLFSTSFLVGPWKQMQSMFNVDRWGATTVYLASMLATLAVAFWKGHTMPVLLLTLVQSMAMVWYCASYIPYGRDMIRRLVCSCIEDSVSL